MSSETDFKKIKELSRYCTLVKNLTTQELNVLKRIPIKDMTIVNTLINQLTKLRSIQHGNVLGVDGVFLSHDNAIYTVNIVYEYFEGSDQLSNILS
jgi:hypothetical protein